MFGDHQPGLTNIWEEFLERREQVGFAREIVVADEGPLGVKILQQGLGSLRGAVGTPDQVRDLVRRYEAAGVDQMIFVLQAGKNRHEHICEAIELFGVRGHAGVRMSALPSTRPPSASGSRRRWRRLWLGARLRRARLSVTGSIPAIPGRRMRRRAAGRRGRAPLPRRVKPASGAEDRSSDRGEAAFRAFVKRSDDGRLEKTVGGKAG